MKRILITLATVMIIAGVASCGVVAFAAEPAPAEGAGAAVTAELEGPCPAGMECNPDGSLKDPAAAAPGLLDRVKALQAELSKYKAARAGADPAGARVAFWSLLGALSMFLLAAVKWLDERYSAKPRLKRWLPFVALGLAAVAGFFDAMVVGGTVLQAMYTATGPILAVLLHELREGWTGKRARTYAQDAAGKPIR